MPHLTVSIPQAPTLVRPLAHGTGLVSAVVDQSSHCQKALAASSRRDPRLTRKGDTCWPVPGLSLVVITSGLRLKWCDEGRLGSVS